MYKNIEVNFHDVSEHDMDMLIMEEFVCNEKFRNFFAEKINLKDVNVLGAYSSLSDEDGESDITFIVDANGEKYGILIEDKIDAITMKEQSGRYVRRGNKGKKNADYDDFTTVLVCPQQYWNEHKDDANAQYECLVFYEELLSCLSNETDIRSAYKTQIIQKALQTKTKGYQVIENKPVTEFWKEFRKFCQEEYNFKLHLLGNDSPKGAASCWPEFTTALKKVNVIYKSDKGYIDLQFPGYGERIGDMNRVIDGYLDKDMRLDSAGKSAVVRIERNNLKISFKRNFADVKTEIKEVLEHVNRLINVSENINYKDLYGEQNENL